jgi:hypothetical protein
MIHELMRQLREAEARGDRPAALRLALEIHAKIHAQKYFKKSLNQDLTAAVYHAKPQP